MTSPVRNSSRLPDIFPELGPVTRLVLFADFGDDGSDLTGDAWREECGIIIGHGLSGVARRIIHERSLAVPPDVLDMIQRAQFDELALTAMTVNQSRMGIDALHDAGIHFAVTKGPGIALVAPALGDRPYVDLDVLVAPDRFEVAKSVLGSLDFVEREHSRQPWEQFDRWCREAVNLRTASGGSIDLHHQVSPWFWSGPLSRSILRNEVRRTTVFGVELPLVSTVHNLLVCALHVVSDKSRPGQTLRAWRDLLVLANACPVDAVVTAAEENGLSEWLTWILDCLPDEVRPTELRERLEGQRPDLRGRFRLKMLVPPGFGAHPLLGHVFRLPVPNAVLFAAGTVVPSREFLRRRYPEGMHNYRRWWRDSVGNISS